MQPSALHSLPSRARPAIKPDRGMPGTSPTTQSEESERATDPVCGMQVDRRAPKGGSAMHAGQTYYFCNPRCREKFTAEPAKYLHGTAAAQGSDEQLATDPVCGMRSTRRRRRAAARRMRDRPTTSAIPLPREVPRRAPALSERRIDAASAAASGPAADAMHTCPMHPEVRQPGPGACPDCGMALEPADHRARR